MLPECPLSEPDLMRLEREANLLRLKFVDKFQSYQADESWRPVIGLVVDEAKLMARAVLLAVFVYGSDYEKHQYLCAGLFRESTIVWATALIRGLDLTCNWVHVLAVLMDFRKNNLDLRDCPAGLSKDTWMELTV